LFSLAAIDRYYYNQKEQFLGLLLETAM